MTGPATSSLPILPVEGEPVSAASAVIDETLPVDAVLASPAPTGLQILAGVCCGIVIAELIAGVVLVAVTW